MTADQEPEFLTREIIDDPRGADNRFGGTRGLRDEGVLEPAIAPRRRYRPTARTGGLAAFYREAFS